MTTEPRLAATVVLVREGQREPCEVLLCQRSASVRAASGAMVFPGGTVDPEDHHHSTTLSSTTREHLNRLLDTPLGAALAITAVRETLEEVGIGPVELRTFRERVRRRELTWSDAVRQSGVSWPVEDLIYFAHWITPTERAHRFDTRFFLKTGGLGDVSPDGEEIVETYLTSPRKALEEYESGRWSMLTPTVAVLTWLAEGSTVADIVVRARRRTVTTIQPRVVRRFGEEVVEVPPPGL